MCISACILCLFDLLQLPSPIYNDDEDNFFYSEFYLRTAYKCIELKQKKLKKDCFPASVRLKRETRT